MQEEGGARGQGLKGQMRRSEIRTRRLGDWKQHLWVPMVSLALRQGNTAGEVGRRGCWDILAATSDKDQKKKKKITKLSLSCFQTEGCVEVSEL